MVSLCPTVGGLNIFSCGEKTFATKIVIPKSLLIDYQYDSHAYDTADDNDEEGEFSMNFGLFLEFLQFSLIRDKRHVSIVTVHNSDSLSLQ